MDIYNALNDSSVLWQNETYGSSWRVPQAAAAGLIRGFRDARLIQLSGQLSW